MLTTNDFDGRILYEAVFETFQRRGTALENEHPLFQRDFANDEGRSKQWLAFMRRLGIKEQIAFQDVLASLAGFLEAVYKSIPLQKVENRKIILG